MTGVLLLAFAAGAPPGPPVVVTVAEPDRVRIVAGGRAEARLVVRIKRGFRVQANPASEPHLVPARLELEDDDRVRAGPPAYPAGKPHRLRGASSELSVYEGAFVIRAPLEAAPSAATDAAPAAEIVLQGTLHYQACNDVMCLRPSSVPVRLPIRIAPSRER